MKISVTIIAAIKYDDAVYALRQAIESIPGVTDVYWFSDKPIPEYVGVPVHWIYVDPCPVNDYILWYSYISLRLIPQHVNTDYDIIIHCDGYPINKHNWTNEFLNYDYIGAKWIHRPQKYNVGNGGFTLRSRKLYSALLDWMPSYYAEDYPKLREIFQYTSYGRPVIAEDTLICCVFKDYLIQKYNLKWAPPEIADKFSVEDTDDISKITNSFGFRGKQIAKTFNLRH